MSILPLLELFDVDIILAEKSVTLGVTVTEILTALAHAPAFGVKVYVPEAVLLIVAGFQLPLMLLMDVVGKFGTVESEQMGAIALKVGVTLGVTVTEILTALAHAPEFGVKVYVPEAVLLTVAGFQLPLMLLVDVVGKFGAAEPEQMGAMTLKVGVTLGVTVTEEVLTMFEVVPQESVIITL